MRRTRNVRLTGGGVAALGAAAALVLAGATPALAFPPVGGKALGFGSTTFDDTAGRRITTCENTFSGHVTVQKPDRQGGEISVDAISFAPCDPAAGVAVSANNLPWTLKLDARAHLTVEGVDLNVVKRRARCRYTGTLDGARSFAGVYTIFGALTRRGTGCDGPARLGFSVLAESISVNGVLLNP